MTFVALSIPDWPTGAASTELLARLLAVAPRAAVTPDQRLAWLDGRGLDAGALARRAVADLAAAHVTVIGTGISAVPLTAAIAARAAPAGACVTVPAGTERTWLAPLPLDVLFPAEELDTLFVSVGLHRAGDLAALDREAVEVRFGARGLECWRRARADDRRPIFSARPREWPTASFDWTDFTAADLEQLVFVVNALLRTICDTLAQGGLGARLLTVTLTLEGGGTVAQPVGAARPTADRRTWLRLVRRALEQLTLDDRVAGLAVQVDAAIAPPARQGDLFDSGFATEAAAEQAVEHILDMQGDAVVVLRRGGHVLPERQGTWNKSAQGPEPRAPDTGLGMQGGGSRVVGASETPLGEAGEHRRIPPAGPWTQGHGRSSGLWAPGSGRLSPELSPLLLPAPREISVFTERRRGFDIPVRYLDNGEIVLLRQTLGPQCLSGERWATPFAREYYQGIRADGVMVLLYHEWCGDRWYLSGWWD